MLVVRLGEEQRDLLLQLLNGVQIPGSLAEAVVGVKLALARAEEIEEQESEEDAERT